MQSHLVFLNHKIQKKINLSEKAFYLSLISVYQMQVCEVLTKELIPVLINQGMQKVQAKILAENICILYFALLPQDSKQLFLEPKDVFEFFSQTQIDFLIEEYKSLKQYFLKDENLSIETLSGLKDSINTPFERLRWKVLSYFKILPSSELAHHMNEFDFIYCYLNMQLDKDNMDCFEEECSVFKR